MRKCINFIKQLFSPQNIHWTIILSNEHSFHLKKLDNSSLDRKS